MTWLGMDIGGANLKAADAAGWARSVPFPLWRDPAGLANALSMLVAAAPDADRLAVTMTGELCDCYETKSDGVQQILQAVAAVAGSREVRVYLVDGRFVTMDEALSAPLLAAASNWRALAEYATQYLEGGSGLVVDIGSTTTDIIPVESGRVVARGRTDTQRLAARELVYSGVGRTPVCAIVHELPLGRDRCPVAAELFATTADAYLLLGKIAEDPAATWTADGKPLMVEHARRRLARQVCADASDLSLTELEVMAEAVYEAQFRRTRDSISHVTRANPAAAGRVLISGAGEFLAGGTVRSALPDWGVISIAGRMGAAASHSGPAFALAVLAEQASVVNFRGG